MTRIDNAVSAADEGVHGVSPQRSVAAVAEVSALQSGGGAAHADERLADMKAGADKLTDTNGPGGVHVDLSGAGKAMALGGTGAQRADRNADIDEADLPDQIKDLLKRIREIREELRQKQEELRQAMADTRLRPEQRKMKIAMLQSEVMALSSALVMASQALNKLMAELEISADQAMVVGQLMAA
ncbi:MAG: hypothetical protein GX772_13920 [Alcaligenaceae bacterium]|nr:hypothetical protein [Alcaligenaceae bacterium]